MSNLEQVRKNLMQVDGGRVTFVKDETTRIGYIYLDHIERRNAISGQMMIEFRECIEELEKWTEGQAVILSGKGTNFCSGADLRFSKCVNDTKKEFSWMSENLMRLQRLPLISVCLVHGPTVGGGAEIAVFCDFLVVADDVKFGFVEGVMGVTTGWCGGGRLISKIGQRKAFDLLLTSKILTAAECIEIGLADHFVSSQNALQETIEWLKSKLRHHYTITRALKDIMNSTNLCTHNETVNLEQNFFAHFWRGKLNCEALKKNIKHTGNNL